MCVCYITNTKCVVSVCVNVTALLKMQLDVCEYLCVYEWVCAHICAAGAYRCSYACECVYKKPVYMFPIRLVNRDITLKAYIHIYIFAHTHIHTDTESHLPSKAPLKQCFDNIRHK